jgi:ACS family sodium-dependent inorganic phosphate cotransporter
MAKQYGWNQITRGIVLSAFFYGYISTQVLGGWLADRFGGKRVLGIGILWWSLFTALTPIAAGFSIWVLILTRVAMGAGEGVMVGSVANVVAHWVRADERARALGLTGSGAVLGVVVAFLLTAPISNAWGWPAAFYLSGALGLLWALLWFQFVTDKPEDHPRISLSELSLIKQDAPLANPIHTVPWKKILTNPAVWSYAIEGFVATWGFYIYMSWLPTYFNSGLGVKYSSVGLYSLVPFVVMFMVTNVTA